MWDLERKNPALLLPGMTVHFEDVTHQPTTVSVPQQVTRTVEPKQSMPLFTVTAPSLQMLIQDEGRFNQTKIGVGVAGAMDVSAMHSANRIVGNPTPTPVIEVLNGGLKAKMHQSAVIAVTGAISNIHVKFSDGQKADFESYQAIALDEGDEFQIQAPTAG
jgi:allophanate hydrolase subunit 2